MMPEPEIAVRDKSDRNKDDRNKNDRDKRSGKMASIREVARLARVAPSTVSRALNGSGYVAEETKEKIREAVDELDYVAESVDTESVSAEDRNHRSHGA